jgi:predicted nucleic acid-binding protein
VISFDTNILVYAATESTDERHMRAVTLTAQAVRSRRCVQTLQSLAEFYNATTRRAGIRHDSAAATIADLEHAMRAVRDYQLSFWDALLWATVRRIGVSVLVSDDFQDGRVIEGVRIANPFAPANTAVIEAALRL